MTPSAEKQIKALLGLEVGDWLLTDYIDSGKSAHVFKGRRGDLVAAVKVFDPELIERYGKADQIARIERQLTLIGKHHPNLINIIDGGLCKKTGHYYLVMDYFDGPSLAKALSDVPSDRVWPIIGQIADAARFLEQLELVHRDIKPANIGVSLDFSKAVLLDLGVMRPVVDGDLTDAEQKRFLGTLRYSPPEFLFRTEEQNPEGWRSITFYQLGAVLHDMLVKERLFETFSEPYARLVEAIRSETPKIVAPAAPPDLVLLAQHCLLKEPIQRGKLVKWDDFQPKPSTMSTALAAKDRIRKRIEASRSIESKLEGHDLAEQQARALRRCLDECHSAIERMLRLECIGTELFPPLELRNYTESSGTEARTVLSFPSSPDFGLPHRLTIWIRLEIKDPASKIVAIHVASEVNDDEAVNPSNVVSASMVLYEGLFEEPVVRVKLHDYLYERLDKAQE